jgi:thioesterase domain-containing protein
VPRMLVVDAVDRRDQGAATSEWSAHADVVVRRQVPGNHLSVLRPPHVDALAAVVAAHLFNGATPDEGPLAAHPGRRAS